jgi:hypothetical protein
MKILSHHLQRDRIPGVAGKILTENFLISPQHYHYTNLLTLNATDMVILHTESNRLSVPSHTVITKWQESTDRDSFVLKLFLIWQEGSNGGL